ncbi:hypothetical protein [Pseudodesulfovibrio sp. zrk46]|uniref:hypothetical protein n=1 Tax=Pseudodesulfovibrio sp. zrk46 TaxID=2725288 RepID=UPI001448B6D8|nr:hypothetical protein [Pseudodesulfovibrio sp. zrk46]QJB58241.1 hypothetical protein HFN16_18450 [Pseudodesulfovibrio sp. zrk46]
MYIEIMRSKSVGKDGQGVTMPTAAIRWDGKTSLGNIAREIRKRNLQSLIIADNEFFADQAIAIGICQEMRRLNINVLWAATMRVKPNRELLREMRMAGCVRLLLYLAPDHAVETLMNARDFGFDICIRNVDGTPYASDRTYYTVAEREAIAKRLPDLHTAHFDLAVAYFKTGRYNEVMHPLGKAMTLRFPINELCLNLLACLSAVKHYPDMAAGLLRQAQNGSPHPVVFRNKSLLKSWLESGGDVRGIRLKLEPEIHA